MSNRIEVLTQCLFGYNKKQVEEYIEEINIIHQKTVNFLKDNIENHRKEKAQLLSELSAIKSFNQEGERPKELMELAIKRAVKSIALVNKMTEEDVEKMIQETKNKIIDHENKVQKIEQDMVEKRREIDQLLNKVQLVFHEKNQDTKQAAPQEKTFETPSIDIPLSNDRFWEGWDDLDIGTAPTSCASKTVKGEIEEVRVKHLVGKTAGVDLLGLKGNLIIAKNGVISPEVVKEAEKEGKLAELIVNIS